MDPDFCPNLDPDPSLSHSYNIHFVHVKTIFFSQKLPIFKIIKSSELLSDREILAPSFFCSAKKMPNCDSEETHVKSMHPRSYNCFDVGTTDVALISNFLEVNTPVLPPALYCRIWALISKYTPKTERFSRLVTYKLINIFVKLMLNVLLIFYTIVRDRNMCVLASPNNFIFRSQTVGRTLAFEFTCVSYQVVVNKCDHVPEWALLSGCCKQVGSCSRVGSAIRLL